MKAKVFGGLKIGSIRRQTSMIILGCRNQSKTILRNSRNMKNALKSFANQFYIDVFGFIRKVANF